MGVVAYKGIQQRAVVVVLESDLSRAEQAVELEAVDSSEPVNELPESFHPSEGVTISYRRITMPHYSGLSTVQNGVLFATICQNLAADSKYTTIHSKDNSQTSSVMMSCDDDTQNGTIQITGWDTKVWNTPLSSQQLQQYIDSVPADSWWTDKQEVVQSFYKELMLQFVNSGGSWPIQSFWDPWANEWDGVKKEDLPYPDDDSGGSPRYCIQASHERFPGMIYQISSFNKTVKEGSCGG